MTDQCDYIQYLFTDSSLHDYNHYLQVFILQTGMYNEHFIFHKKLVEPCTN